MIMSQLKNMLGEKQFSVEIMVVMDVNTDLMRVGCCTTSQ